MAEKRVIILGATGSIGRSTFDVVQNLIHNGHNIRVVGISCRSRVSESLSLARQFDVERIAATSPEKDYEEITWSGKNAIKHLIEETDADIVVNGIAGSPGLLPSFYAIGRGMDLALANKETIVMAGPLLFAEAEQKGTRVIPVDSEHSAIFFLLKNRTPETVKRIIITASGGAFRTTPLEEFPYLSVEDALSHPTWNMGAKITIDSATMANKGLEVIEAHRLFAFSPRALSVSIHPQSTVHSFIETLEGSLYAQLSSPDMRIPIQNALTYPELTHSPFGELSLDNLTLSFETPDYRRYPMLSLAYSAIQNEGPLPIVYNAANEIAVEAFQAHSISFPQIAEIVEESLSQDWTYTPQTIEEIMNIHHQAEDTAQRIVSKRKAHR